MKHYCNCLRFVCFGMCAVILLVCGCQEKPSATKKKVMIPAGAVQAVFIPSNARVLHVGDGDAPPGLDVMIGDSMHLSYREYEPESMIARGVASGGVPMQPREQIDVNGVRFLLHVSETGFTAVCPDHNIIFVADGPWNRSLAVEILESIEFRPKAEPMNTLD